MIPETAFDRFMKLVFIIMTVFFILFLAFNIGRIYSMDECNNMIRETLGK